MKACPKITGKGKTIAINGKRIIDVGYRMESSNDSNARSTNVILRPIIPVIGSSSGERIMDLDIWSRVQNGTGKFYVQICQIKTTTRTLPLKATS